MPIVDVVNGIRTLIRENLIARTNLISDVTTGDIEIQVTDSFHFNSGEEVLILDNDYNVEGTPHFDVYEYAVVDEVIDTHNIKLTSNVISNWTTANNSFIQKTIGHAPLYTDRVYYGDREVIPSEEMSITIEPTSLSNEWIFVQGGLSEEYRLSIIIYGKDVETEEGMIILNKYADALYLLFMNSLHIDLTNYDTPLVANVAAGTTTVVVPDTATNRETFLPTVHDSVTWANIYNIQDNVNVEIDLVITSVSTPGDGKMYIEVSKTFPPAYGTTPLEKSYSLSEYATFTKVGRYMYDSRVDNIEYATVQKGSAFIRAARLNWYGKETEIFTFPQHSLGVSVDPAPDIIGESSSSSSSSSYGP